MTKLEFITWLNEVPAPANAEVRAWDSDLEVHRPIVGAVYDCEPPAIRFLHRPPRLPMSAFKAGASREPKKELMTKRQLIVWLTEISVPDDTQVLAWHPDQVGAETDDCRIEVGPKVCGRSGMNSDAGTAPENQEVGHKEEGSPVPEGKKMKTSLRIDVDKSGTAVGVSLWPGPYKGDHIELKMPRASAAGQPGSAPEGDADAWAVPSVANSKTPRTAAQLDDLAMLVDAAAFIMNAGSIEKALSLVETGDYTRLPREHNTVVKAMRLALRRRAGG